MNTKPHLELVLQIRAALNQIERMQNDYELKKDPDYDQILFDEKEYYDLLRDKLCAMPIINENATFQDDDSIEALQVKKFEAK